MCVYIYIYKIYNGKRILWTFSPYIVKKPSSFFSTFPLFPFVPIFF